LIKPQFEAGPENVDGGVVKDPDIHYEVINKIIDFARESALCLVDLSFSPITGAQGHNIEYLAHFSLDESRSKFNNKGSEKQKAKVREVITKAQKRL
jgi:23S rRNA (cytidine1920-2'-O)/16S rRNA (cytidine1409-2'-O)-methyltransferase